MQNNYLLMFLSSSRWLSLRLEIMTNLLGFAVALFVVFGISSASYSYKSMAISLILQVRKGVSDSGGLACGPWADPEGSFHGTLVNFWVLTICDLMSYVLGLPNLLFSSVSLLPLSFQYLYVESYLMES